MFETGWAQPNTNFLLGLFRWISSTFSITPVPCYLIDYTSLFEMSRSGPGGILRRCDTSCVILPLLYGTDHRNEAQGVLSRPNV